MTPSNLKMVAPMLNPLSLLKQRSFAALFTTQFFGAFNDNLFKTGLVLLLTFNPHVSAPLAAWLEMPVEIVIRQLNAAAGALFILPFFIFSALAGEISDKYPKDRVVHGVKVSEIVIMLVAAAGFMSLSPFLLLLCLFAMGVHSAFFGPTKYSLLPDILTSKSLLAGNALVQAATFAAILLGSILAGVLIAENQGTSYISIGVVAFAIIGWIACLFIERQKPSNKALKLDWNILRSTFRLMRQSLPRPVIGPAMLGFSWFWLTGMAMVTLLPLFTKNILGGDEYVSVMLLAVATIGASIGSITCNRLLKGKVSSALAPYGAGIMAIALFSLSIMPEEHATSISLLNFLFSFNGLMVILLIIAFAIGGGLFAVPLFVLLQAHSADNERSQVIAAANILNALFMVAGNVMLGVIMTAGINELGCFAILAALNGLVAVLYHFFNKRLGKKAA